MSQLITRESLIAMLEEAGPRKLQHIVGRALLVLYESQTTNEKYASNTHEENGIGFTGPDAYWGSQLARYYRRNGRLSEKQMAKFLKRNSRGIPSIAKYWKQLNDAAVAKQQRKS